MRKLWVSRAEQAQWDETTQRVRRGRLLAWWRQWRQPHPHPVTGDMLSPTERVIWVVITQYRRLRWFFALQALTAAWLLWPRVFPGGDNGWMIAWSDLAVIVEQVAGIAIFAQMLRDSLVTRTHLRELREDSRLIREIHQALMPGQPGHVTITGGHLELRPHQETPGGYQPARDH